MSWNGKYRISNTEQKAQNISKKCIRAGTPSTLFYLTYGGHLGECGILRSSLLWCHYQVSFKLYWAIWSEQVIVISSDELSVLSVYDACVLGGICIPPPMGLSAEIIPGGDSVLFGCRVIDPLASAARIGVKVVSDSWLLLNTELFFRVTDPMWARSVPSHAHFPSASCETLILRELFRREDTVILLKLFWTNLNTRHDY